MMRRMYDWVKAHAAKATLIALAVVAAFALWLYSRGALPH